MSKADELWEKYLAPVLGESVLRQPFKDALAEYGDAVSAENAELRKDAERYRKLRALQEPDENGYQGPSQWGVVAVSRIDNRLLFGVALDEAIDRARSVNDT